MNICMYFISVHHFGDKVKCINALDWTNPSWKSIIQMTLSLKGQCSMWTRIDGGYVECVYVAGRFLFIRYSYCFRRIYWCWQRQIRGRSWIKSRQPFQDYHRIAQGPIRCSIQSNNVVRGEHSDTESEWWGGGLAVHDAGGLQFQIPETL